LVVANCRINRSLLHLLFVAITCGKVSLWLWKRLEISELFLRTTLWPPCNNQGGHSSGKPGKVRELKSGQGKVRKIGKVREKSGNMNYYKYSVVASIVLMG